VRPALAALSAVALLFVLAFALSQAMPAVASPGLSALPSDQSQGAPGTLPQAAGQISVKSAPSGRSLASHPASSLVTSQTLTHTLSLPFLMKSYCPAPAQTQDPFGVEIAAIHQVISPTATTNRAQVLTSQQWRAYLDSSFPTLVTALKDSGASWTRVYLAWDILEPDAPVPGQLPTYNWGWYDPKLQALANTGVQIIATINWAPAWAASPTCGPIQQQHLADYRQFVSDVVKRYMQPPYNINHWEISNEPDWWATDGSGPGNACFGQYPAQYAQMLAEAYRAVKSADPQATVIQGGIAYDFFTEYPVIGYRGFYRYFIDQVMAAGGSASSDALAFHYFPAYAPEWERWVIGSQDRLMGWLKAPACGPDIYDKDNTWTGPRYEPWGKDIGAKLTHLKSRMSTCYGVNKPIWVTEIAQHGFADQHPDLTDQARYVIQGMTRAVAYGAEGVIWYALSTPNENWEMQLLFNDFMPKPAFYAFKTLNSELKGYKYRSSINTSDVEAYIFSAVCRQDVVVAWGSGTLPLAGAHLRVVDYLGNVSSVNDGGSGDGDGLVNGSITVQLTDDPAFLQVTGG
jgi:hypothetical protein